MGGRSGVCIYRKCEILLFLLSPRSAPWGRAERAPVQTGAPWGRTDRAPVQTGAPWGRDEGAPVQTGAPWFCKIDDCFTFWKSDFAKLTTVSRFVAFGRKIDPPKSWKQKHYFVLHVIRKKNNAFVSRILGVTFCGREKRDNEKRGSTVRRKYHPRGIPWISGLRRWLRDTF